MEEILNTLENVVDWEDIEKASFYSQKALKKISSDRDILKSLLESVLDSKDLISLCEHYDFFDKIVLHKDELDRFRIRLHVFLGESHKDRPHNHRWFYSSIILRGSYQHLIYGTEDRINKNTNVQELKPIMIGEEKVGSIYTLNHNVFHSVGAAPYTVSVIIRGTAVKDRFLIMDKKTNKRWWEYGRKSETIEEIRKKAMPLSRIKKLITKIHEMGLLE